jgi:hypothetical protein
MSRRISCQISFFGHLAFWSVEVCPAGMLSSAAEQKPISVQIPSHPANPEAQALERFCKPVGCTKRAPTGSISHNRQARSGSIHRLTNNDHRRSRRGAEADWVQSRKTWHSH